LKNGGNSPNLRATDIGSSICDSRRDNDITELKVKVRQTTCEAIAELLNRDGGVIVENFFSHELATQIKIELKLYFDTDRIDKSHKTSFFPEISQRASRVISTSGSCTEFFTTPIVIDVVIAVLKSTYSF
jgi:hypothetical protein